MRAASNGNLARHSKGRISKREPQASRRRQANVPFGQHRSYATTIPSAQSAKARAREDALIRQADKLLCESRNERMWADREPIDPSPTIDRAINGAYPWLEIECSRCKTGARCRPRGPASSADAVRPPPGQQAPIQQICKGRPPTARHAAAADAAAAPPAGELNSGISAEPQSITRSDRAARG
jgi:hypothetical protein